MAEAPAAVEGLMRDLSFSDGVKVEPFQLTLHVLTANIKGDKKANTPRDHQKDILEHFFHEHQPDVILVQENLWPEDNIKSHLASIGGNYAAVSSQSDQVTTVLHRLTDDPKLETNGNLHYEVLNSVIYEEELDKALLDRARIVSFVAKGPFSRPPEPHLIAISWHGPTLRPEFSLSSPDAKGKTGTDTKSDDAKTYKKNLLSDLLKIVNYLNSGKFYKERVPVILGGDFNIDYKYVQDLIKTYGLQLLEYPKPPSRLHRVGQIDYFIVTSDVTVNRVYTIPYEMDPNGDIFGHVPVMARLTLTVPITVRKVRD